MFYCNKSICTGCDCVIYSCRFRHSSIQLVFAVEPVMNLLKLPVNLLVSLTLLSYGFTHRISPCQSNTKLLQSTYSFSRPICQFKCVCCHVFYPYIYTYCSSNMYINQRDAQVLVNCLYFFVKWLYMFRTIIRPSSGATFNKLYSAIGTCRYVQARMYQLHCTAY